MSLPTSTINPPARTHAEAAALFRRLFAPGAIRLPRDDQGALQRQPYAGAQVAAYIGAQSVIQRLNAVVPGRWRQQFQSVPAELVPGGTRKVYLAQTRPARLSSGGLQAASGWLERYREFWEESFERLDEYLDDLQAREDRS